MCEFFFKSANIWQSYKQERGCLMHFARLANTLLKDEVEKNNLTKITAVIQERIVQLNDDDIARCQCIC